MVDANQASLMQSLPANTDATNVSILSAGFALPGASREFNVAVHQFSQPQIMV